MVGFNLPVKTVKRCERDRAWLSHPGGGGGGTPGKFR